MLPSLSVCARATAAELLIAVPGKQQDLYDLHQRVWSRVSRAQAVAHRPTILYRCDKGLVRVRVSNCAMFGDQPVRASFCEDDLVSLEVRMALSRDGRPMTQGYARNRVFEIFERSGLDLIDAQLSIARASGYKQGMRIELGVADVEAKVRIRQPEAVAHAWRHGIGRGKRFGFGMMVFKA